MNEEPDIDPLPKSIIHRLKKQLDAETEYLWAKESFIFKLCRKYLRFYRNPWAMRLGKFEKKDCGWEKRERILKKMFPIQWFIRNTIPSYISYKIFWIRHKYYDFRFGKVDYSQFKD